MDASSGYTSSTEVPITGSPARECESQGMWPVLVNTRRPGRPPRARATAVSRAARSGALARRQRCRLHGSRS